MMNNREMVILDVENFAHLLAQDSFDCDDELLSSAEVISIMVLTSCFSKVL